MTDKDNLKANLKRRHFLLTAGIGGVGAAAAVMAVRSSGDAEPATDLAAKNGKGGYRMTEHIANYYRTARV
ncbi:formate dehydrogenase [Methyloversatilis sp.]|uniref:formate dehydrogenase n=1 Tax=Methyloversatilis sp. TaxID=2569862 RepID=UPI002735B564|nr:formate dehydrogenase [Methyloversatilis sp.]MDP2869829.1 formate dehydrogenase [Methyloversatilis sp.]MDP3289049.1 formate dehydrogenase [Methyloversatilis sp.]MDP3453862.1 formate dehydrogenase [Methyloversatilis sp.]MDP3576569.1 formate dehydrogenase [Methyloversatilis sp.]